MNKPLIIVGVVCLILLKLAFLSVLCWIAWHFISKWW